VDSVGKFFAMGGYAVYVWPAIGLTVAVMAVLAWQSWRSLRRAERAVSYLEHELDRQADTDLPAASEADGAS